VAPFHPATIPQIEGGAIAITTSTYDISSGRMLGASIEVPPGSALSTGGFIKLLGFALGLTRPFGSVDSTLAAGAESTYTMPTALDREAYCVLYGDPPYCE
jgi:hypothetical protein